MAVQALLHVPLQEAVGLEEVREGPVAAPVGLLREVDRLIHAYFLLTGKLPGQGQQALEALLVGAALDEGAHHDGPHVHHGVDVPAVASR